MTNLPSQRQTSPAILLPGMFMPAAAMLALQFFPTRNSLPVMAAAIALAIFCIVRATLQLCGLRNRILGGAMFCGVALTINLSGVYLGCGTPTPPPPDPGFSDGYLRRRQVRAFSPDEMARVAKKIPPRDSKATAAMLDLTRFYNATLEENFRELHYPLGQTAPFNLASVSTGTIFVSGYGFDVRGVIRLSGKNEDLYGRRFPDAVRDIPVGKRCSKIAFLGGVDWRVPHGTVVARYIIHFAGGRRETVPVIFDRDLQESWRSISSDSTQKDPSLAVWTRTVGSKPRELSVRLFAQQWTNPLPSETVQSIDFISAQSAAVPFLLAITLDTNSP
jgi:hypothetical protein